MSCCPVTRDLNNHISKVEAEEARESAICDLACHLWQESFSVMRKHISTSNYSNTGPSDLNDAMCFDDEYFYKIAESIIDRSIKIGG